MIGRFLHRIAHWLGWNGCITDVRQDGDRIDVGRICVGCGQRTHAYYRMPDGSVQ